MPMLLTDQNVLENLCFLANDYFTGKITKAEEFFNVLRKSSILIEYNTRYELRNKT